jgi:hypothetical protein
MEILVERKNFMRFRLFLSVALVATFSVTLPAQQAPTGYHTVACIKVKPGKGAEYRKWEAENVHKLQQASADSGRISAWFLLGYVMPAGSSAACDYLSISLYPGVPTAPMGMDALGAALKKSGLAMSAQEYVDHRSSLTDLVASELWQNTIAVGTLQKGDYLVLNHMKIIKMDEWIAYEKKVWQPFAESMVKEGVIRGWFLNVQEIPGGSELKYQASTVDVYPSWDAYFKFGNGFAERFKKVHPDMDINQTFENYEKLRTIGSLEMLSIEDFVAPAK